MAVVMQVATVEIDLDAPFSKNAPRCIMDLLDSEQYKSTGVLPSLPGWAVLGASDLRQSSASARHDPDRPQAMMEDGPDVPDRPEDAFEMDLATSQHSNVECWFTGPPVQVSFPSQPDTANMEVEGQELSSANRLVEPSTPTRAFNMRHLQSATPILPMPSQAAFDSDDGIEPSSAKPFLHHTASRPLTGSSQYACPDRIKVRLPPWSNTSNGRAKKNEPSLDMGFGGSTGPSGVTGEYQLASTKPPNHIFPLLPGTPNDIAQNRARGSGNATVQSAGPNESVSTRLPARPKKLNKGLRPVFGSTRTRNELRCAVPNSLAPRLPSGRPRKPGAWGKEFIEELERTLDIFPDPKSMRKHLNTVIQERIFEEKQQGKHEILGEGAILEDLRKVQQDFA